MITHGDEVDCKGVAMCRVPTFCVLWLGDTKTKHPPPSFCVIINEDDRFFTRFVCKVFQMVSINNSTTQQPLNYINIRASVY